MDIDAPGLASLVRHAQESTVTPVTDGSSFPDYRRLQMYARIQLVSRQIGHQRLLRQADEETTDREQGR